MIKAVIFDWGGTCSQYNIADRFCEIVSEDNDIGLRKVLNAYEVNNKDYLLGKISGRVFFTKLSEILKIRDTGMLKNFKGSAKANPKMIKLVRSVKKNYKTGLISDNYKELSDIIAKKHSKLFNAMIFSNRAKTKKPGRKIFLLALKRLRVKPSECVFIDDKENNVWGARKTGIKSVQFKNITKLKLDLANMEIHFRE